LKNVGDVLIMAIPGMTLLSGMIVMLEGSNGLSDELRYRITGVHVLPVLLNKQDDTILVPINDADICFSMPSLSAGVQRYVLASAYAPT
jgi:hypothetical protein